MQILTVILMLSLFGCQTSEHGTRPTPESPMKITITPVSANWLDDEERWEVLVDVRFENAGATLFQLDKVTACSGGQIQNHVFVVKQGDTEIDYRGIMRKRAPPGPNGFHRLEPGDAITERVDLGQHYSLPASGVISVKFDHYNHFSPDAVQLVSDVAEVRLAD